MATEPRLICASADLTEGGPGVRFEVDSPAGPAAAFVVRYQGQAHAYLNRCAHVPVELDWQPGHFFDEAGRYLICATHGATYLPETGQCVGGPCAGKRLAVVAVVEVEGKVWLRHTSHIE